ncbi:MAG: hypothetical protein HWE11_05345 [Gammaproteobacteria bacterium]|nr:hypothetical protein [Gammaproteobacteria bacterium]
MEDILDKLTDYTLALRDALDTTNEANERQQITKHLAVAAEMYALLNRHGNLASIESVFKSEIRNHGWSFISGEAGTNVAKKWIAFTNATDIEH